VRKSHLAQPLDRCFTALYIDDSRRLSDGEVGATPDTVFNEEDEQ
jgi:hypothetical protein